MARATKYQQRTQEQPMNADSELQRSMIQRVNVGDLVTRAAAKTPAHVAIVDGNRRITYAELERASNQVAHGFLSRGYKPGQAVALMSYNSLEFLVTYFACAKAGLVCVPINLFWRNQELAYVIDHAEVRGVVVASELIEQLETGLNPDSSVGHIFVFGNDTMAARDGIHGIPLHPFDDLGAGMAAEVPPVVVADRAPLTYLYTSGTTSKPKGVVGSHLGIYLESLGTAIDTKMGPEDIAIAMLPLFHTAQLNAICTPVFSVGGTVCVLRGFDATKALDLVESEGITVLFGLPMMYRSMLELQRSTPRQLGSLRLAVYAMATMPDADLRSAIETFDCDFSLMFGQTEMSPVATFFRPEHQLSHAGAVGTPAVNVQVGIMDESGRLLPQGEAGEIVYRSPQALTEYLRNETATDEAFKHGWFHSGDVGSFDKDGILWFKDRFKDVIKSGGENISSLEVEKAIYEVAPEVAEAVVVGLPHERWTEAVTAIVVARDGATIDKERLAEALRGRLSPFKCPKAVIVATSLPKTATGKLQKSIVRNMYVDHFREEPKAG
jgi:acyl-CoA synthetase (AMP-forming)/AMP-acid ligase II